MPFHNIQDPTLVRALIHLNELRQGTALEPNGRLLDQAGLKLRSDSSLYQNGELILNEFSPIILDIVRSDSTTRDAKNASIQMLDSILDHFTFDQILSKFNMNLLIEGLSTDKSELRILITQIISKARPADIVANTSIVVTLFRLLANEDSSIGLVNSIQQCILILAANGELVRRRILSDEVTNVLLQMKQNSKVAPRLYDLIVELLPIIPDIPERLYLVTFDQFENDDDLLLNSLIISFYSNILQSAMVDARMKPIVDSISEQIDYITRVYIDKSFKTELRSFFNLEPVIFLCKLSQIAPQKFASMDSKYHILDYAIDRYTGKDDDTSIYLLANVEPRFLETKDSFLQGFELKGKTTPIYNNLIKDQLLLESKLPVTSSQIAQLEVSDFLEVIRALSSTDFGIYKLVNTWSSLIVKLLSITDITSPDVWQAKLSILDSLYQARSSLGVWSPKIVDAFSLMKNGRALTSEASVMDTTM
ncbi:hypothetical protein FOA43_000562 [Brettanomyces nanus]|uniref:DNA mismatch repair protein HSM3 N-terminal domain-containing protein n=1 Tax=Eeniella nana TaxID=13502 RepID=A0A875S1H5_EENNA|nr:uncharacterized protein FOA43_000562 [Brettanomyces nanus]QPG73254.1 hypothetical protein FOA43_000562 [Brettanomyces nanus]